MLNQKLIESRMIKQVGMIMEIVKEKWNRLLQVGINY